MPFHFPGPGADWRPGIVYILHPILAECIGRLAAWNDRLPVYLAAGGGVLFLVDCVVSVQIARTLGNKLEQLEELGKLIKAHAEGLGLPSAEDLELKLAAAYDAFESRKKQIASRFHREDWRALPREEAASRLRRAIDELQDRRDSLLLSVKSGHKRLLRAFPTMKREGDNTPLEELKNRLRRHKPLKKRRALRNWQALRLSFFKFSKAGRPTACKRRISNLQRKDCCFLKMV